MTMTYPAALRWAPALVACALFLLWTLPAAAGDKWEVIANEEGIVVSQRWPDGQTLPTIRGVGELKANIYEVLAVLADIDRTCEWLDSCDKAKLIKESSDFDRVTYNRFSMPWPLDARDAVLQSKITLDADKKTILVRYWDVERKGSPPVEGVVRVPSMKGFYKLEQLDDKLTRVTYQGEAEPGGNVPDWIVARASRNIPLLTIKNLRAQTVKTQGQYEDFVTHWDPKRGEGAIGF
jgi:hypothetical protein